MASYVGDLYFSQGGTFFDLGGPLSANTTITEDVNDGTFTVGESATGDGFGGTPATYAGTVNLGPGQVYAAFEQAGGTLYILVPPGVPIPLSGGDSVPAPDANPTTICFLDGTGIETPAGRVPVQSLQIGDLVVTSEGRHVPVRWVGRQKVLTMFGPAERLMPVRVRAGALGDGLPRRDLLLTADHALVVDDMLINAGALVNGLCIDWVPLSEFENGSYMVYHVETEHHDVILAEGAPAETYIDYVGRRSFDNYQEYLDLYGAERTIHEMDQPRISSARLVPDATRSRLNHGVAA